jgi:shikimate kinase
MLVSLWGFMGAGKSTIGNRYATRFDWKHLDSDQEIENEEGFSIKAIFETTGEPYFRSLETKYLQKLLEESSQFSGSSRIVLATGGGMPIKKENRELLKKLGTSIFIHVPFEQIIERLKLDQNRPLWNQEQLNLMKERYAAREPIYQKADHILHTHNKTVDEIVLELNHLIHLDK